MLLRDGPLVPGVSMVVVELGWRRSREVKLLHNFIAVRFPLAQHLVIADNQSSTFCPWVLVSCHQMRLMVKE